MQSVVLALGGSLIDLEDDTDFLKNLVSLFQNVSKVYRLYVVVGGGKTARKYIGFGRQLGVDERRLDELGISVTRLNALLVASLMEEVNNVIPSTTSEAAAVDKPVVVMGGTTPGHSTDAVAAELAAKVSPERFVIATDVDGVYDRDPKKHDDAKLFDEVTIEELERMCGSKWGKAGENVVVDGPALSIIKGLNCDVFVVNGRNLGNLENTLYGKGFVGTKIKKK
ncbi:MAG: UMP kinase [Thermoplasmata archaeon]|nr:MAG: UMP kinase [Thermoplasmata archaeon]